MARASANATNTDKAAGSSASGEISYEAARDELLDVVRQLEAGGLPLEKSLALWERGEELAVVCQAWLDGARERLAARRPGNNAPDSDSLDIETTDDGS